MMNLAAVRTVVASAASHFSAASTVVTPTLSAVCTWLTATLLASSTSSWATSSAAIVLRSSLVIFARVPTDFGSKRVVSSYMSSSSDKRRRSFTFLIGDSGVSFASCFLTMARVKGAGELLDLSSAAIPEQL